ncbi:MAG TPA: RNA 3'-terminal phosphate cyclase [Nitrososphaerales archaeon]|nr:RNA 3'-terminal phosphate cyclase [Nitrososphaerales archaeon]
MEFLEVDGSQGEGGGQILRTALAFSGIQSKPVKVTKIRAGRPTPGLKRQHISAVEVLAEVFGGQVRGAKEGSSEVRFIPGPPRSGSLSFDMGTAASITLVLQAVVPAVALAGSSLSIELVGGTDVPWSPTFDYFRDVVRQAFGAIGIKFEVSAIKRGYYPRGGGKVKASINPSRSVVPIDLLAEPSLSDARIRSRCGGLPGHVAERQLAAASEVLAKSGIRTSESEVVVEQTESPGSSVLVYSTAGGFYLGSDAIGARGKRADAVGSDAGNKFVAIANSGACLDSNLADMLLPLLSLAPGPSRVKIPDVTTHLESGLRLARQFTSCTYSVEPDGKSSIVTMTPTKTK